MKNNVQNQDITQQELLIQQHSGQGNGHGSHTMQIVSRFEANAPFRFEQPKGYKQLVKIETARKTTHIAKLKPKAANWVEQRSSDLQEQSNNLTVSF